MTGVFALVWVRVVLVLSLVPVELDATGGLSFMRLIHERTWLTEPPAVLHSTGTGRLLVPSPAPPSLTAPDVCVNVWLNVRQYYIKCFEWPTGRKALNKRSPFTI